MDDYKYNLLLHVSPSQLKTFDMCPRKHWLEKIGGIPTPTSAGAAFGTRGHAAVEHRIEHGVWPEDDPDAVRVAMAGWKYVPQGRLLVEQEMNLDGAVLPIIGRIDLIAPEQSVVLDHKFMSSMRYAKKPAELEDDPQAILYVKWAAQQGYLRVNSLTFRHIVYQTKGTLDACTVQAKFLPAALDAKFDRIKAKVDQMASNSLKRDPAQIVGAMESSDPSPCKAYGGCPHVARCTAMLGRGVWSGLTTDKDIKEDKVNVLEMLAKKRKAQGLDDVGAINPPDGAAQPAAAVAAPTTSEVSDAQPDLFGLQQRTSFPPSEAEAAQFAAQIEPQLQTPTSSKINDPFALATLYVGCLPVNENFLLLDQWLAPLVAEAAQSMGVDYYAQAEYGKGKTALGALIGHKVKVDGVPPVLVVDPRLPASDVALEVLRPLYKRIVMRIG
jgi:hypothetical protein